MRKAPLTILQDLCFATKRFSKERRMKAKDQLPPLHIAAVTGMSELCKFVMFKTDYESSKERIEVTIDFLEDKKFIARRCTALHLAALKGHFDVCKIIFEQTEDKNYSNSDGDTPLHYAAKNGHLQICKFLIENGMDKSMQNKNRQTPFDLAEYNAYFGVCILLNPSLFWKRIFIDHFVLLMIIAILIAFCFLLRWALSP